MSIVQLDLGETEMATVVAMLSSVREQQLAMSAMRHTTEAERDECTRKALVCDIVIKQIQGSR